MANQEFINQYTLLLIKQYWEKTNARLEIESSVGTWSNIYDLFNSFETAFDIDTAVGSQLDIIGKIVGVNRSVPLVIEKIRFGFDGDATARGMASIFDDSIPSAPFFSIFEEAYTSLQLDDYDYRLFIKAKVAKNVAAGVMVSDDRVTIQDAILQAFEGLAYIIDNQNMTLSLYVSTSVDAERIRAIKQLGLIPKPQGVSYDIIFHAESNSFGFSDDPNALGFGSIFNPDIGGTFATLII